MSLYKDASLILTPNGRKEGKIYSIKPGDGSGDMTAVRATTKTEVNSSGVIVDVPINVPSFDYTNGSCPSILVEPQRTNLETYSEQFDNVIWGKTNVSISSNSIISPDATINADKLVENTINGSHLVLKNSISVGGTYTLSVFLKSNGRNWVLLNIAASANYGAWFDLQNGVVGTIQSNIVSANIVGFSDGWYRCSITANTDALSPRTAIYLANSNNSTSYTGDGTSGIYIWGAQLEAGSYATSYIPTVASAVTRNADVISKTGLITNNFLSATGGTWFVDLSDIKYISGATSLYIGEGENNKLTFGGDFATQSLRVWLYNNSIEYSLYPVPFAQRQKIAFSFTLSQLKIFVNGDLVFTRNASLNCNLWTNFFNDNGSFSCRQNSMMFFNTQLTDQECIELTTL